MRINKHQWPIDQTVRAADPSQRTKSENKFHTFCCILENSINFALQSTFKLFKMNKQNEQLEALTEMRSMMERSSRFISLSGLSGVFAGVFALIGSVAAYKYLHIDSDSAVDYTKLAFKLDGEPNIPFFIFFIINGGCVLFASIAAGIFFTVRKAKQKGQNILDSTGKRLIINLFIPLATGGLFCLALLIHHQLAFIPSATLIFYGLSLLNASKYTLDDIRYLGMSEIVLGLISTIYIVHGLIFWAVGFGVLHIVYGTVMYYRHEK